MSLNDNDRELERERLLAVMIEHRDLITQREIVVVVVECRKREHAKECLGRRFRVLIKG